MQWATYGLCLCQNIDVAYKCGDPQQSFGSYNTG